MNAGTALSYAVGNFTDRGRGPTFRTLRKMILKPRFCKCKSFEMLTGSERRQNQAYMRLRNRECSSRNTAHTMRSGGL